MQPDKKLHNAIERFRKVNTMGAMQNNQAGSKNGGRKKRGSVKNASRLEAFANKSGKGQADWGGCNSERLQGVIVGITAMGGAVTFSLSRDTGSHGLTLLLDKERSSLWFNGDSDLDAELDDVMGTLASMVE